MKPINYLINCFLIASFSLNGYNSNISPDPNDFLKQNLKSTNQINFLANYFYQFSETKNKKSQIHLKHTDKFSSKESVMKPMKKVKKIFKDHLPKTKSSKGLFKEINSATKFFNTSIFLINYFINFQCIIWMIRRI